MSGAFHFVSQVFSVAPPHCTALLIGSLALAAVATGIYLGSGALKHFDRAVGWYVGGAALAAFAVGYRSAIWAQRPPARMYFKRGMQLLLRRHVASLSHLTPRRDSRPSRLSTVGSQIAVNFVAQDFIRRRSYYRWIMHLCLSGGSTLAFAITFPLVFGWVHFETAPDNAELYRINFLGFTAGEFDIHGPQAFLVFNLLNLSAIIVLIGLVMAMIRRIADAGERATQTFTGDILPLILIFAVTVSGLMLTVSYKFLEGRGHGFTAIVHLVSVIALLWHIPFGKLFHMFQRVVSLCVSVYKQSGASGPQACCVRCGDDFASRMHVDDLKAVLDQLGFNYRFATGQGEIHYQDICPACRRRLLTLNQGRTLGR